jgi:hypothetical protein
MKSILALIACLNQLAPKAVVEKALSKECCC